MRRDRVLRSLVRSRFVVTTTAGETFDGILIDHDETLIVLADPQQISERGDRLTVDGCLYLDRAKVAYMQRPEGAMHP